jgi:hypothetical protein
LYAETTVNLTKKEPFPSITEVLKSSAGYRFSQGLGREIYVRHEAFFEAQN